MGWVWGCLRPCSKKRKPEKLEISSIFLTENRYYLRLLQEITYLHVYNLRILVYCI